MSRHGAARGEAARGRAPAFRSYHLYRIVPVPAYVEEWEANSPSNLARSETPLAMRSSAPAEVSAEFFASVAPFTMKLAPAPGAACTEQ